jgi:hypothetical protein
MQSGCLYANLLVAGLIACVEDITSNVHQRLRMSASAEANRPSYVFGSNP